MELGNLLLKERPELTKLLILASQRITCGGSSPHRVLDAVDLIAQAFLLARHRTLGDLELGQLRAEIRVRERCEMLTHTITDRCAPSSLGSPLWGKGMKARPVEPSTRLHAHEHAIREYR